jgi:hypothetical protein
MPDLSLEIQVGLAAVVGFVAMVASLLIWRGSEFRNLFSQLSLYSSFVETGLAPEPAVRARYKLLAQGVLQVLGILGCMVFFWNSYHYLELVRLLVAHSVSVDFGLFERLKIHTEIVKTDLVLLGFVISFIFALEWLTALFITSRIEHIEQSDIPVDIHLYQVPSLWRMAFTAMWVGRLERACTYFKDSPKEADLESVRQTRNWQSDWPTWATAVTGYQIAISPRRTG